MHQPKKFIFVRYETQAWVKYFSIFGAFNGTEKLRTVTENSSNASHTIREQNSE